MTRFTSRNLDFFNNIARLIETLKKLQFSGQVRWTDSNGSSQWVLYFHLGHLFYTGGGVHSIRRWARSIAHYCPQLQFVGRLPQGFYQNITKNSLVDSEYDLLYAWLKQAQITNSQAKLVIHSIASEVLFDLSQYQTLNPQIQRVRPVLEPFVFIDEQQVFIEVQTLWQRLWNYNLDPSFLDKAPIIKHPMQLQQRTSSEKAQVLVQVLDGKTTLRDLSIQLGQDVIQIAHSLQPYVQSGLIELITIPDLLAPVDPNKSPEHIKVVSSAKPLIACVDDSVMVCSTMEKLLTEAGYQFIAINDGLRAITTLLSVKPELILLDVFMPYTNGYEICKTLRIAPSLRHVPIVFLTGLDGIVDQVRAKLSGASDFLSKPIDADKVLSTVAKHLPKA